MPQALRPLPSIARAACAGALLALLASCSGSVDPSPNVVDTTAISILPSGTATTPVVVYSGLPTEFVISGGTGQYIVTSNNQAAVPISLSGVGNRITVVANPVVSATVVTLSVRDTSTTPQVSVVLDVRPGTVDNSVQITPTLTNCSPGVCTGGDALVSVLISQGNIPLAARGVRFDVVQGAFRFITTAPGASPEITELSTTTVTDETGRARVRIRATALAPTQTALLQVTDIATGAFQRTAFPIVQFTGGAQAFFALPSSITFTGPAVARCATSGQADVVVFGGSPPYAIVNSFVGFAVSPQTVTASGGRFTVSLTSSAACSSGFPITITDSSGRTISITVNNVEGTQPTPPPPVSLVPTAVTLGCPAPTFAGPSTVSLTIVGGGTSFSASSSITNVVATVAGNTVTLSRLANTNTGAATAPNTVGTVTATDGVTSDSSQVTTPTLCPP